MILNIIRDGHYLALEHNMNLMVLREANGRCPDLPPAVCCGFEHLANWLDSLNGGRPVAGYGSRQTVDPLQQLVDQTVQPVLTLNLKESSVRVPLTAAQREEILKRLETMEPTEGIYICVGGPRDKMLWKNDTGVTQKDGNIVHFLQPRKLFEEDWTDLKYLVKGSVLYFIEECGRGPFENIQGPGQ